MQLRKRQHKKKKNNFKKETKMKTTTQILTINDLIKTCKTKIFNYDNTVTFKNINIDNTALINAFIERIHNQGDDWDMLNEKEIPIIRDIDYTIDLLSLVLNSVLDEATMMFSPSDFDEVEAEKYTSEYSIYLDEDFITNDKKLMAYAIFNAKLIIQKNEFISELKQLCKMYVK